MICQRRITAGVDLKLGHSCLSEPYRASIFMFLAEWDYLSVPWGPRQNGRDHLTPDHPCGIWRMELSLQHAHPTGKVPSLNCVYLLSLCRKNLPINCMLILSVNDLMIFLLLSFTNHLFEHTNLQTSSPHSSLSHHFLLALFPLLFTSVFLAPPIHLDQVSNTYT